MAVIDSLEIARRQAIIQDNGPIYNEFIHDSLIHEPWNAYSSLFFFIPVVFWIFYLRGQYRDHKIIVAILPLLFLNGLGSTLFHAFRASNFFLLLDWMPASIMSLILSTFFWTKIVKKWYLGLLCVLGFYFLAGFTITNFLSRENLGLAPNIGYFFVGCSFFIPILVNLYRNSMKYWYHIALSFLFLVLSLVCRTLDYPTPNPFGEHLPQGTHFLWHVFSSFAVFSMGFYIYLTNRLEKGITTNYK